MTTKTESYAEWLEQLVESLYDDLNLFNSFDPEVEVADKELIRTHLELAYERGSKSEEALSE